MGNGRITFKEIVELFKTVSPKFTEGQLRQINIVLNAFSEKENSGIDLLNLHIKSLEGKKTFKTTFGTITIKI